MVFSVTDDSPQFDKSSALPKDVYHEDLIKRAVYGYFKTAKKEDIVIEDVTQYLTYQDTKGKRVKTVVEVFVNH
jgi:hypothetical protein